MLDLGGGVVAANEYASGGPRVGTRGVRRQRQRWAYQQVPGMAMPRQEAVRVAASAAPGRAQWHPIYGDMTQVHQETHRHFVIVICNGIGHKCHPTHTHALLTLLKRLADSGCGCTPQYDRKQRNIAPAVRVSSFKLLAHHFSPLCQLRLRTRQVAHVTQQNVATCHLRWFVEPCASWRWRPVQRCPQSQ